MNVIIKRHWVISKITCFFPFIWLATFLLFLEIKFQYEIYVGKGVLLVFGLYTLYCLFALGISLTALRQGEKHAKRSVTVTVLTTLLHCVFFYLAIME